MIAFVNYYSRTLFAVEFTLKHVMTTNRDMTTDLQVQCLSRGVLCSDYCYVQTVQLLARTT